MRGVNKIKRIWANISGKTKRKSNADWGLIFRKTTPISRVFGLDRGKPIDRYYIDSFLQKYTDDIRGYVMEVGDNSYTRTFGSDKVINSDVLHVTSGNRKATIVGNLATGEGIPQNRFDCMILTQTLPFIYDVKTAIGNAYYALKPGGILLVTVSGLSQISRYDMNRWGDFWRFTDASASRLFSDVFGADNITVETYGNVLTACAFLQGLATEELTISELDFIDPDYQMIITIRAIKN